MAVSYGLEKGWETFDHLINGWDSERLTGDCSYRIIQRLTLYWRGQKYLAGTQLGVTQKSSSNIVAS